MISTLTRRQVLGAVAAGAVLPLRSALAADKQKIRIGQIGTSHAHATKLSVYRDSPDYDVVGIVEPDERRWESVKSQPAYRDMPRLTEEQLFNRAGLQAVMVETAVADLVPAGQRCLDAGFHIHLDKPAGGSLEPFAKLLATAETKQRMVQMGYMLRYSPATALLKRLMAAGALGDVFEVTAVMSKVVAAGERKKLAQFPGGMMFELGCHVIDSVVGLLGKPTKITAFAQSILPEDGLRDSMLAVFEYPKATATVRSSALEVDGGIRRQFVVCGTGGTLRTEPLEPPKVRLSLANAFEAFKKGTHEVEMPRYARYVGDAADMAAILRGEKANDYPPAHDLLVHECVLKASGL